MAVFAKFSGIEGGSKDADHKGWVEVFSLAHDPKPGNRSYKAGRFVLDLDGQNSAGFINSVKGGQIKAELERHPSPVKVTIPTGAWWGLLNQRCLKSEEIAEVLIDWSKPSKPRECRQRFTGVMIASCVVARPNSKRRPPSLDITFTYKKVKSIYGVPPRKGADR